MISYYYKYKYNTDIISHECFNLKSHSPTVIWWKWNIFYLFFLLNIIDINEKDKHFMNSIKGKCISLSYKSDKIQRPVGIFIYFV
jgi:hypothetical protein